MSMIEFDEYKGRLNAAKPGLDGLGRALKLDDVRAEISSLEAESAKEGFWNDVNNSQKVQKRLKQLQNKLGGYEKLCSQWDDLMTICEMAIEENDESMLDELKSGFAQFESTLESMRLSTLLSGEIRRQQRHTHNTPRRRRHRGPGLGPDALPHVHPLGRAPRLYLHPARLAGRRGGGHQVRQHQD